MRRCARPLTGLASVAVALALAGCGARATSTPSRIPAPVVTTTVTAPSSTPPATTSSPGVNSSPVAPVNTPPTSTSAPTSPPPPTSTPPAPPRHTGLRLGDKGAAVLAVQKRLQSLGYWLGEPDGTYGDLTQQAVYAVQKAAGLGRDGVVGPRTKDAIAFGVRPSIHSSGSGHRIEIDKQRQLLLILDGSRIRTILNTSTGSGRSFALNGGTEIATTPVGTYQVFRQVDHWDDGPLGALWRPKYFNGGIAVHGLASVPPYPASHGCARVSIPAMDMIWSQGLLPIGTRITVV